MDDSPGVPMLSAEALRAALTSVNPARRASAVARAGTGPGVEDVLLRALEDPHHDVRRASIRALARLGTPAAARAIARTSSIDTSPSVRGEAVTALGRMLAARTPGGGVEQQANGLPQQ